jgi:tetratricopeptide (TPR) repeat protein
MPERERFQRRPPGQAPGGPDPAAEPLPSRVDPEPSAPGGGADWAAVAAGLEREAAAIGACPEAGQLLFEAGRIHEEHLGDPAAALAFHRRALALDPAFLPNLRACRRLAMDRGEDALAADAWLATALADLHGEGGREAALAALDRALEARGDLVAALELRARLRAEAGRHAEALADLEQLLAHGGEPGGRLRVHLSAAALSDEGLRDPARAVVHLNAALALAPGSPEALARLARLRDETGLTAEAAAALRRLVEVPGLPRKALVGHLLALAEAEERLGSPESSAATCRRALALDPRCDEAHRRLVRLEGAARVPLLRLDALEDAAANARDPALRADCRVEAARLLAAAPDGRDRALAHLRGALALDPSRVEVRASLAELLDGPAPAAAIVEHRNLLALDPLRAGSWSALFRHFERTRAHDRAYVAASVLRWLGAPLPGPSAERLLLEGARQKLAPPPSLPEEDLAPLRAPGDGGPLAAVIEAAGDAIAAGLAAGANRGELLRPSPLQRVLADLGRAFGVPEWELRLGTAARVDVEPGVPYVVRVGPDVARRCTAREQRFLLGRAAIRLRSRSCLADLLPPATLAGWVAAALRLALPSGRATGPADDEQVRQLARVLPRRARRGLEEAARALAVAPSPSGLKAWGSAAAVEAASSRPDVLALLAFAATEEHFLLRQRLRVAIA